MIIDIREFKSFPQFKERFLSYLPKNYQDGSMIDSCWNWQGADKNFYGKIKYGRENYSAHKMAYIIFNGPIRSDQIVRHICDNPSCMNPKHLILGNYQDNSMDMVKRNRHGSKRLNEECVKVIKWMLKYKPSRGLVNKLANLHNVSPGLISNIGTGRKWAWVKV